MERLKEWRKEQQMTQTELAEKIGTDKFQVSRWEQGKHKPNRMAREQLRRLGFI